MAHNCCLLQMQCQAHGQTSSQKSAQKAPSHLRKGPRSMLTLRHQYLQRHTLHLICFEVNSKLRSSVDIKR